jgi:hypothetical protein
MDGSFHDLVFCPCCRQTYRSWVSRAWYRRQVRRRLSYAELLCTPCLRAQDLARQAGGDPIEFRNPEEAPV